MRSRIKNNNYTTSLKLEAYREIRTNIEYFNTYKSITSILITSAKKSDGKSSVASNLAISFANINKNVLIIDCNFKNPSIHKIFDLDNELGLIDIFINDKDFEDCVNKSKKLNLDILTSGKVSLSSSEILSQEQMKEFINKMKSIYDYVFIDTPSIGTSIDAGIMSQYTDGTIFVISPNIVTKEEIKVSKQRLKNVDANIIGVVFNKYNKKIVRTGNLMCYSK